MKKTKLFFFYVGSGAFRQLATKVERVSFCCPGGVKIALFLGNVITFLYILIRFFKDCGLALCCVLLRSHPMSGWTHAVCGSYMTILRINVNPNYSSVFFFNGQTRLSVSLSCCTLETTPAILQGQAQCSAEFIK